MTTYMCLDVLFLGKSRRKKDRVENHDLCCYDELQLTAPQDKYFINIYHIDILYQIYRTVAI